MRRSERRTQTWHIRLDPGGLALAETRLTHAERRHADRFRRAEDRALYAAARAAVRTLLGLQLGLAPAALPIVTTENGKPALADQALAFNLAHSADAVFLAISDDEVGVDLETPRTGVDLEAVAQTVFSGAELRAWRALPPERHLDGFYRLWVLKEAYLKAVGLGFRADPRTVTFNINDGPARLVYPNETNWRFAAWRAGVAYAAIVYRPDHILSCQDTTLSTVLGVYNCGK
jgi:4'-phosphopantetheinyl transferase